MRIYYTDNYGGGRKESRRLLGEALAVHTGDDEKARALIGALKKGEHGKPYIEGFSCFSISHTGSIWAVLVAERESGSSVNNVSGGKGVDIEEYADSLEHKESVGCGLDIQLVKKCDVRAIAERWFAPEDAAMIADTLDEEASKAHDLFFRIWTRREALVKAMGGTVYDPDIPAVSLIKDEASVIVEINGVQYTITDIEFPEMPELYAAICLETGKSSEKLDFTYLKEHFQNGL